MLILAALVLAFPAAAPDGPVEFGERELGAALAERGLSATKIQTHIYSGVQGPPSEGYDVAFSKGLVGVASNDNNGLMYGLLEAAERIRNAGNDAWKQPVVRGKPYLADRGWNMFLPLPWDYDKNFVDNDPAALTDPKRWFFMDDHYWRTLFDQMARSRLNWLDIHGPYDLDTTRFPNLYAYFIQSDKFPKVGVAPEIKATLLKQLNRVIDMAHARGIRVTLMSYEARFDVPHNPRPGYQGTEAEVYDYTKEVVEKMIRRCPELDKIGYRIGESGRGPEFFRCYTEAVKASGRDIPVYTRSWVTRKARVVPLARESSDFTVEIKYNGEQWGAPYIMAGGRTANWYSYWYEDYLSDSGEGKAKQMWPGNEDSFAVSREPSAAGSGSGRPTASGQRLTSWPSQPYKIVWQVRANGTHRIFPFYQPHWTRSSILSMKVGTASGYTIESMASYFPQEPRYYLNPSLAVSRQPSAVGNPESGSANGQRQTANVPYKWIHQRDEMYMACWGRLGYDPDVPDWKFDRMVMRKFGPEVGRPLAEAWKAASKVVPIAFMAYSLGPDHRNHAPELEWGGDTEAYLQGEPFDSHVFMNAREEVAFRATGGVDGRIRPSEASFLLAFLAPPRSALQLTHHPATERELAATINGLQALANYYEFRFLSTALQASQESGVGQIGEFKKWEQASQLALSILVNGAGKFYKPFTDRLRMHSHTFHWSTELAKAASMTGTSESVLSWPNRGPLKPLMSPDSSTKIGLTITAASADVRLSSSNLKRAWLLEKPLPSSTFFHKTPMKRVGDRFVAEFKREPWGHCVAAEIQMEGGVIRRIPWWENERPYLVVPSMQKPTPYIYSTEEAMAYLKPEVLDPAKYGWLIVAQRGWNFHTRFDLATKRKLLSAVERGMNLLVMQQDYASGRYPLDFLPVKPKVLSKQTETFDPGGELGMERVETKDILWQPFVGGNRTAQTDRSDQSDRSDSDWQIFGNGGVARLRHGKGEIWIVQARFIQRMHIPGVARNLLALLKNTAPEIGEQARRAEKREENFAHSKRKPAIIIDAGTEGGYVTSVIPDFMNAHDLPFLTLGEVIAKEQGMDSMTVVPGPVSDDTVLGGKGPEMMKNWLEAKVKKAAARPLPKSREEMEARKPADRKEFMRMMGLDPLPPRTPLNARITGIIHRPGYRIEKLVYESRPGFFVTAHLYVPDLGVLELARALIDDPNSATAPESASKLAHSQKHPVILNVHGHWPIKKQTEVVQSRCIFQALHGYVALCIDTPGTSFEAASAPIERRWQGNHNDWTLLLGSANTTALYAWDAMRGLDYLETRPECDTTRVGITGASGGGLAAVYNFVADERIKCAIPVVYATSLEVNPHNGCLCNHVPATLQVGDRSDLLAIRAPNPILVIGAQVDAEFPPEGTQKTGEKLRAIWKLYGKEDDAQWKVFPGGHDYNKAMRELAMGFFDKHLKGIGDGSPVPEPVFTPIPNGDPELIVLRDPATNKPQTPAGARTQRDIAKERLAASKPRTWEEIVKLNGGVPTQGELNWRVFNGVVGPIVGRNRTFKSQVTFQSEAQLSIPGVIWRDGGDYRALLILISENGKGAAYNEFEIQRLLEAGYTCVALDVRGFGELQGLDQRLMTYLGTSEPFAMGWDVASAFNSFRFIGERPHPVVVIGRGPTASQAAMFAALFEPRITAVLGLGGLKEWEDAFADGIPSHCVMPRADLAGPLSHIRSLVKPRAVWTFLGEKEPDLDQTLNRLLSPAK